MKEGFYTLQEMMDLLKLSRLTLYRYIKAGKLKAYKFGKEYRISQKDYEIFLSTYEVEYD